jgi:DnaJ-class molecular chaperone
MTRPADLRQQPGVCPECKGSCRTGSGYLREDCPACNGTGQQTAQPDYDPLASMARINRARDDGLEQAKS